MGKLNTMLTNERKTILQPALSESNQSLCDQDFSQPIYLLGGNLPEELRKAKGLASSKKRPSTSSESLTTRTGRKIIQAHSTNNRHRINGTHSADIRKGTDYRTSL